LNLLLTTLPLGQRQLIWIARAILSKPAILVFDEATSSTDVESEAKVTTALKDLTKSRKTTLIVIAHRLGTVKGLCDEVVVLDEGVIVETGKVDSLLKKVDGHFAKLAKEW
jgi:ABC-type multidrug transport system fused ATPase/permease subunit